MRVRVEVVRGFSNGIKRQLCSSRPTTASKAALMLSCLRYLHILTLGQHAVNLLRESQSRVLLDLSQERLGDSV